jgi:3',5'-cyclic AMP phosphodiesterase CpdA
MRPFRRLLPILLGAALATLAAAPPEPAEAKAGEAFLVLPYLQLGKAPALDSMSILWHAPDLEGEWSVRLSVAGRPDVSILPSWTRVAVPTVAPHRVYQATLRPLEPGGTFTYRVLRDGSELFRSSGRALKAPGQAQRVVVAGDLGQDAGPSRALAQQLFRQHPDLVLVPGDVVYQDGRISEYRRHFFPVFNAGVPLLRSTAFVAALGNHDVGERGPRHPRAEEPDSLAYYLYWDQPLNGPAAAPAPPLAQAPDRSWEAFRAAAGPRFPAMGSFSFDSGDVHWTVLDSNPYVDWEAPELREWLARDLEAARGAAWRIVLFHHPAFNFAEGNAYVDQWMARTWPVLEQGRVDLVLTGHIHTYARTLPLRFVPQPGAAEAARTRQGEVPGRLSWDRRFDGKVHTRADGVIHVTTGGSSAHLHLKGRAESLKAKPYVARIVTDEHSFTVLDIAGRTLEFRQLGAGGAVLDRFTLRKAAGSSRRARR